MKYIIISFLKILFHCDSHCRRNGYRITEMDAVAKLCFEVFRAFGGTPATISKNISFYDSVKEMSPNQKFVVNFSLER